MSVLYVGGITPSKGIWDLLLAASKMPDVVFWFVGEPVTGIQPQIEQFIQDHMLDGRVKLLGAKHNREVRELMLKSDVFCLPSYGEGLPVSVLEAMSCGMPVVATSVGGIPEIVTPDMGGYLIAPSDVESLVGALTVLRDHPERRQQMGEYNRRKVIEQYQYGIITCRLTSIYDAILGLPL